MDIRQLGPKLVEALIAAELVKDVSDLFALKDRPEAEILALPKVGAKKREALLAAIEAAKDRPLENLLAGLNVRHLGHSAAHTLARRFGTLLDVMAASRDSLLALEGIGTALVDSLFKFLDEQRNLELLCRLIDAGVGTGSPVEEGENTGPFLDKTIVVTGELENFTREAAQAAIKGAGGKATSSVSKKTSFIVAGRAPGMKKLEKAQQLEVPVIDESEFMLRLQPSEAAT
jgi:DNA ligase (NAD+)